MVKTEIRAVNTIPRYEPRVVWEWVTCTYIYISYSCHFPRSFSKSLKLGVEGHTKEATWILVHSKGRGGGPKITFFYSILTSTCIQTAYIMMGPGFPLGVGVSISLNTWEKRNSSFFYYANNRIRMDITFTLPISQALIRTWTKIVILNNLE